MSKKKSPAKKNTRRTPETATAAPVVTAPADEEATELIDLEEVEAQEAADLEAASSGKPAVDPLPGRRIPYPGKPSFDWSEVDGKKVANITEGEDIISEVTIKGLKRIKTTRGRFIFLCTVPEYEEVFERLPSRSLWEDAFPHAL